MNPNKIARQTRGRLLELMVIMVFGLIIAFSKALSGFEMFFPGNPPGGSSDGDDVS